MAKNTEEEWKELRDAYEGNPLVLKMAIYFIHELYNGSISEFMNLDTLFFGDIESLAIRVYESLSEKEKYIVKFLVKKDSYNSIVELMNDLFKTAQSFLISKPEIIKTIQSLKRQGLI